MTENYIAASPDIRYEGWDIVVFKANDKAYTDPKGKFHNGRWGYEQRFLGTPGDCSVMA